MVALDLACPVDRGCRQGRRRSRVALVHGLRRILVEELLSRARVRAGGCFAGAEVAQMADLAGSAVHAVDAVEQDYPYGRPSVTGLEAVRACIEVRFAD